MVFDGPNRGLPSKNVRPASNGRAKDCSKIFLATIGVPLANVNNAIACMSGKRCIWNSLRRSVGAHCNVFGPSQRCCSWICSSDSADVSSPRFTRSFSDALDLHQEHPSLSWLITFTASPTILLSSDGLPSSLPRRISLKGQVFPMDKLFQDSLLEGVGSNSIRLLPQAIVQRSGLFRWKAPQLEAAFPSQCIGLGLFMSLNLQSSKTGGSGLSHGSIRSIDWRSSKGASRSTSTCSLSIRPGPSSACSDGVVRLFEGGDAVPENFPESEYRMCPRNSSPQWDIRQQIGLDLSRSRVIPPKTHSLSRL
jgi:hypothetical protein